MGKTNIESKLPGISNYWGRPPRHKLPTLPHQKKSEVSVSLFLRNNLNFKMYFISLRWKVLKDPSPWLRGISRLLVPPERYMFSTRWQMLVYVEAVYFSLWMKIILVVKNKDFGELFFLSFKCFTYKMGSVAVSTL